jgi:hypothetical protein
MLQVAALHDDAWEFCVEGLNYAYKLEARAGVAGKVEDGLVLVTGQEAFDGPGVGIYVEGDTRGGLPGYHASFLAIGQATHQACQQNNLAVVFGTGGIVVEFVVGLELQGGDFVGVGHISNLGGDIGLMFGGAFGLEVGAEGDAAGDDEDDGAGYEKPHKDAEGVGEPAHGGTSGFMDGSSRRRGEIGVTWLMSSGRKLSRG